LEGASSIVYRKVVTSKFQKGIRIAL
jgi:hypothetical protein